MNGLSSLLEVCARRRGRNSADDVSFAMASFMRPVSSRPEMASSLVKPISMIRSTLSSVTLFDCFFLVDDDEVACILMC